MLAADDPYGLSRFVQAQEGDYERALAELRSGQKRTHWMWYIFPQLAGLGFSPTARRYAVKSLEEARAWAVFVITLSSSGFFIRRLADLGALLSTVSRSFSVPGTSSMIVPRHVLALRQNKCGVERCGAMKRGGMPKWSGERSGWRRDGNERRERTQEPTRVSTLEPQGVVDSLHAWRQSDARRPNPPAATQAKRPDNA